MNQVQSDLDVLIAMMQSSDLEGFFCYRDVLLCGIYFTRQNLKLEDFVNGQVEKLISGLQTMYFLEDAGLINASIILEILISDKQINIIEFIQQCQNKIQVSQKNLDIKNVVNIIEKISDKLATKQLEGKFKTYKITTQFLLGVSIERETIKNVSHLLNFYKTLKFNLKFLQSIMPQNQQWIFNDFIIQYLNQSEKSFSIMLQEESERIMKGEKSQKQEKQEKNIDEIISFIKKNPQCVICQDSILYDDQFPLQICKHIYHRLCLNEFFKNKIKSRDLKITCIQDACNQEVHLSDLQNCLDEQTYRSFFQFSMNQFVDTHPDDMSWCPTPGCKYAFVYQQGDTEYNCPLCKKRYCLACRVDFHDGQTCLQYRQSKSEKEVDNKFDDWVKSINAKQCPNCKFWVEKNQGCNHMTCRCKYEFCYVCGGKYKACACILKR